jgi:hypothetical protein
VSNPACGAGPSPTAPGAGSRSAGCDAGPSQAAATATVFAELDRAIAGLRLRERALLRERWALSRHYREMLRQVRSQIEILEQAKRDLDNPACGACPPRAGSGICPPGHGLWGQPAQRGL